MYRLTLAVFALLATQLAHAADSRAEFLKLLERPRVPAAATVEAGTEKNGITESAFSYASDAENRVPGILLRSAGAAGSAKRPVVIALHGTGGNKESQRAFLTEMAKAGF